MDITVCKGGGCSIKEKCHRYTSEIEELYQSYFTTPPHKNGGCEMFIDNTFLNVPKDTQQPCSFFELDTRTSSATKCRWCGLEKIKHYKL